LQALRSSIGKRIGGPLNQLVETYALYYVQETEEPVPTWGTKEEVLRALKTRYPRPGKSYCKIPNWKSFFRGSIGIPEHNILNYKWRTEL
jgi:hypothetical protein